MGDGKNARTKKNEVLTDSTRGLKTLPRNVFARKLALGEQHLGAFYEAFRQDMAQYNITVLFPLMLTNLYQNDTPKKSQAFKHLVDSEILQYSFTDFDLDKIHSKSLDYRMFRLAKQKRYFAAYLLISPDTIK